LRFITNGLINYDTNNKAGQPVSLSSVIFNLKGYVGITLPAF